MLDHQPVIAGDARLALGTVRYDPPDLLRILRHELDIGRETRSAETDDTGFLDFVNDFLACHCRVITELTDAFRRRIFAVIGDDDRFNEDACVIQAGFNDLYLPRDRRMDIRGNESIRLRDQLAYLDGIIFLNDRYRRFAEMLTKGKHKISLGEKDFERLLRRELFIAPRMNASSE